MHVKLILDISNPILLYNFRLIIQINKLQINKAYF